MTDSPKRLPVTAFLDDHVRRPEGDEKYQINASVDRELQNHTEV